MEESFSYAGENGWYIEISSADRGLESEEAEESYGISMGVASGREWSGVATSMVPSMDGWKRLRDFLNRNVKDD